MSRLTSSTKALCLLSLIGLCAVAHGTPGPIEHPHALQARALLPELITAEARLIKSATVETARSIQRQMVEFEGILDRYFHAPNLREAEARPHVLALRRTLREALAGPPPLLIIRGDILHFRGSLQAALGVVFLRNGEHQAAAEVYLRALATDPKHRVWLAGLLDALSLSKDPRAGTIRARIAALEAASKVSPDVPRGDD